MKTIKRIEREIGYLREQLEIDPRSETWRHHAYLCELHDKMKFNKQQQTCKQNR